MSDLLTKVLNGNLTITVANAGEIIESAFSTLDGLCISVYEAIKDAGLVGSRAKNRRPGAH